MNYLKAGAAVFGLVMLTACAGPTVHFDYDSGDNFSKYKAFDWYAAPGGAQARAGGVVNPLMDARVHRIVEKELAAKGFQRETAKDPDFLVVFYPTYQPFLRSGAHVGFGMGLGFGRFTAVGVGGPVGSRYVPPVGNMVLEVKDFKTNRMIWRAEAEEVLDSQATPEEADQDVTQAVRKMLGQFPPVASAR
jgi:hypothetical protein